MSGKILVVEDDYLQSEWLIEKLKEEFPDYEIELLCTESDFYRYHAGIVNAEKKPDVVLMDVMLSWADPSPNMPEPPEEVKQKGFYEAGLRCRNMMISDPKTRDIHVVLYTQLENSDLREADPGNNYMHLRKDANIVPLLQKISSLLEKKRI